MGFRNPQSSFVIETHGDGLMHHRLTGSKLHLESRRNSHLLCGITRRQSCGHVFSLLRLSLLEFSFGHSLHGVPQHVRPFHTAAGNIDHAILVEIFDHQSASNPGFAVGKMRNIIEGSIIVAAEFKPIHNGPGIPHRALGMM